MGSSVVLHVLAYSLPGATLVWGIIACAGDWAGGANLCGDFGDAKLNAIRAFLVVDIRRKPRHYHRSKMPCCQHLAIHSLHVLHHSMVNLRRPSPIVPARRLCLFNHPFHTSPNFLGTDSPFDPYYDDPTTMLASSATSPSH